MATFKSSLFDNLRKLISIVDELRDAGVQDYISLPRICVLGTQSAGKSSLLENVVGLDFLPRGEGVVTRRPLELRLIHTYDATAKPYAIFDKMLEKKFTDFDEVRRTIEKLTNDEAGPNCGIIPTPIKLSIFSPDCPDLTIIDLPGITRIPLKGSDQPENIEEITKNMARKFEIDLNATIILCVIPANQDLTTQDGLQMAIQQLDPSGVRTIGVITKIDIMGEGSDASKIFRNEEIELKLGYVGVKNRSQLDIKNNVRVQISLKQEEEYFAQHPIYSKLPRDMFGTRALVDKLSTVMFKHIRQFLPKIMEEINAKVIECEDKLRRMGTPLPVDQKDKMQVLYNMLIEYTENFKNIMRGKYDPTASQTDTQNELSGGAKIKRMFNELYSDYISPEFKVTKRYSDKDIDKAITLHQGDSIPGFPSFDSFLFLIVPRIQELKEPAMDILNETFAYMDQLALQLVERVFMRFPQILGEIQELTSRVLAQQRDKAKKVLENQLESELDFIFTNDREYLTSRTNLSFSQEKRIEPKQVLIRELRARVDQYYRLVIRNLRDTVPKIIGHFMVKLSQDLMQLQLYNEMLKNPNVMGSLEEPVYLRQEREQLNKTLSVLKRAQKVMKKDQEYLILAINQFHWSGLMSLQLLLMSHNKNYANYYDYEQNRTKTKVAQMPGGNSQLSLAWDAEPVVKRNIRSFSPQVPPQQDYQVANLITQKAPRYHSPYAHQQDYQPPQQYGQQSYGQQPQQYSNQLSSQSYGGYAQGRRNEGNMGADGGERTSVKVAQQPGGNSNMIFGDYNHFKQDEGPTSSSKPPRSQKMQAPTQAPYQQQQQQQSPFQSSYNNVINNFPPQQQGQYAQQQQPQQEQFRGQVRVNQPPGGRSNFTFG